MSNSEYDVQVALPLIDVTRIRKLVNDCEKSDNVCLLPYINLSRFDSRSRPVLPL